MNLLASSLALMAMAGSAPNSLTLEAALAKASLHQPELRRAQAEVNAARARARQALAALLPQLSGSLQYQRTTGNFVVRPGAVPMGLVGSQQASFDTFDFFSAALTASQLIYDFGRSWDQRGSARASARASEYSRRATAVTIARDVRLAFFEARAARALVRVAAESLANQSRHMVQIRGFVELGTRPEIDLAQARTDLANLRVRLINAENAYAAAKAELVRSMGLPTPEAIEVADDGMSSVDGESLGAEALFALAVAARPEIAALEQQVRAEALSLSSIEGGYWPRLSASTTFSEAGTELDALTWNWDVTVALSWSLYEGGMVRAQAQEAAAALARARAELAGLKSSVRVEVERARLGIIAAKEAARASMDAVTNARERLRLAEGRYETGVGSAIELGDARVALTDAEAQQVQAELDLASARATLRSTLGRL